ncbi:MAG: flippase-like domain-containing protein, partial [Anaerolineae bacterium]|nr:flippase-like domain-containing protein [Anaerolineae bacterium]
LNKRDHDSPSLFRQALLGAESQIGAFIRQKPRALFQSSLLSVIIWASLFGEYALALKFLGLETSFINILAIIIFARLAFLTPLPGGLGALEAGQVFAMQALGFDPVLGVSMSLFIRLRDTFFALIGLWLGSVKSHKKNFTEKKYV